MKLQRRADGDSPVSHPEGMVGETESEGAGDDGVSIASLDLERCSVSTVTGEDISCAAARPAWYVHHGGVACSTPNWAGQGPVLL